MPGIMHLITIRVAPERVYEGLTTAGPSLEGEEPTVP
jgi:hypothetical protein